MDKVNQSMKKICLIIVLSVFAIFMTDTQVYAAKEQVDGTIINSESIFDNHKSVMLLIDSETGEIIDANTAAQDFYGYSKEELLQMNISDINTLSEKETKAEMQLALLEKRNYFEFKHRLANGKICDVEVYSSPLNGAEGNTYLFSIVHDITDKKLAQHEVSKNRLRIIYLFGAAILFLIFTIVLISRSMKREKISKNKLESLFDNMSEGVALHEIILDDNGKPVDYRFLDANKAFEQITGLKSAAIMNRTVKEIFPNTEQYWIESYANVALTGEQVNYSNYSAELGKYFNVNVYSPTPKRFVTIFSDVTNERKAQEKIENEKKILEFILEDSLSGYWDWDITTDYEYYSPSFKSMLGYEEDEIENSPKGWQRIVFEEDLPVILSNINRHIMSLGKEPYYNEVRYHHKNGSTVWVICSGRVVEWDKEKPLRMVGCHINITKIKELEKVVSDERNLLKTTLHSIGDGVISTDFEGNVDLMNKIAEQLTGWSNQDAKGNPFMTVFNIVNEYSRERCDNPIDKVMNQNEIIELEENTVLIKRTLEEVPIEDSAAPIRDEKGNIRGAVVVFRDCSEKKEKQEKIQYLSYHDQLTGIYNRHYFEEELLRLDVLKNLPFSIAMVDVNGLKLTNDAFGHEVGDLLLKSVANVLQYQCREDHSISRIGGDEFVVLMPNTDRIEAELLIKNIYREIEFQKVENIIVSVSIGYETKENQEQNIKEVFAKAEDYMYRKKITESQSMRNQTIKVIMQTLNEANTREKVHSERVSKICRKIGLAMQLDEEIIKELEITGLMHDIGKIAINNDILNKPGKLTETEYDEIKKHPEISYHILKSADVYTRLAEYVLAHHERWDGKGYPRAISGEEIPLVARIITVADAYEAMTGDRPYKRIFTHDQAIEELNRCAGTQFDPDIVKVCDEHLDEE